MQRPYVSIKTGLETLMATTAPPQPVTARAQGREISPVAPESGEIYHSSSQLSGTSILLLSTLKKKPFAYDIQSLHL